MSKLHLFFSGALLFTLAGTAELSEVQYFGYNSLHIGAL